MDEKKIREHLKMLDQLKKFMLSLLEKERQVLPPPVDDKERLAELTTLRLLSKSPEWPEAVPSEIICEEDQESRFERAKGIIDDLIHEQLDGKTFLDFGCGEGHIPFVAGNFHTAKIAVGYDPKEQNWNKFERINNLTLTTDWEEVKKHSYDIILVNDVLDHTEENIFEKLKEVKKIKGKIYLRCHPWSSRTGTHLYKHLNKAYLHLVFTEQELSNMGLKETPTIKNIENPLTRYHKMIDDAGLKVIHQLETKETVEDFFTQNTHVLRRIKEKWSNSENVMLSQGLEFPRQIMEVQFVDLVVI